MRKRCSGLTCIVLMLASVAQAQANRSAKTLQKTAHTVPTAGIGFKDDEMMSGLIASPVVAYPMQCADDGTVFTQMFQPPEYAEPRLYSISPGGVHEYAREKIADLHDARVLGYYPSGSRVILLVNATYESRQGKHQLVLPGGEKTEVVKNIGERRFYLAEFDRDGSYKRVSQVDDSLAVNRVGMFDSGNFLVFGVNQATALPQLAILNSDGALLRFLDIPGAMKEWAKGQHYSVEETTPVSLAPAQFVPFNGGILVIAPGSRVPVLEVKEGGAIRPVRLGLPTGLSIDSFIPSNGNYWYIRVRNSTGDEKASDPEFQVASSLYEINPADGAAIRQIQSETVPSVGIACVHDNTFIAFRRDENGKLVGMRGEIRP
jgi:hypothetical protein